MFDVECRFGLPLRKAFALQVRGDRAAVVLLRERAPLEFVDPTNSVVSAVGSSQSRPFALAKPLALPATDKVYFQAMTLGSKDTKFDSPEAVQALMSNASILAVFDPLETAVSLRSKIGTEVAIVVERTEAEWKALGPSKFDEAHSAIWDEFVRTYQMVTADVRPPYWNDGHRLLIVKQGWVRYDEPAQALDWQARLTLPCEAIPIDRHRVSSSYAMEGKFQFDTQAATAMIERYFAAGVPVPLSRETLAGAQRAVDLHRSGKTAIVECTIALEIAVAEVVSAAKVKAGVSKKKLDEYKKEIGLGYQVNVDLPMLLAPLSDDERQVLGAADAVRKRRNEIIHAGAQPTREEGEQAVKAVRTLLDLLRSRGFKV
ncbi:MAG: hypothetical protein JNL85_11670 [Rubrivivax sp.]|nr:hypothetical protein [Rubrivivax sp.]